jgi:hypothetical protein
MPIRVLLDNCIPWRLAKDILTEAEARGKHIEIKGVISVGWDQYKDGQLLDVMDNQFDVLVTVDKGLQQRVDHRSFAVLLLRAKSNRMADLLPIVPSIVSVLNDLKKGQIREISAKG